MVQEPNEWHLSNRRCTEARDAEREKHRANSEVDTSVDKEAHRRLQTCKYTQAQTQNCIEPRKS